MLSAKIPATNYVGKSVNMFWDGVFHFFCLLVTLVGVVMMWRLSGRNNIDRSGRVLAGGLLLGWGLFNIVEGLIDHHLLKLHNVVEIAKDHSVGNLIFLGLSVVMVLSGFLMTNKKGSANS